MSSMLTARFNGPQGKSDEQSLLKNLAPHVFYFISLSIGGTVAKNLPAHAGDTREAGSTPGSGRSSGVGNGNLLQYSCLGALMDRGVWLATVHRVAKSWTRLSTEEN